MQQESKLLSLPEDWQRALAVAAHPDDLEYGAASAIARWTTQGKEVVYLLITSGEAGISGMHPDKVGPLREGEEKRSAAAVGVDTVEFLHHKDGVIEYGPALRRDIARAIRRHRPEVILAPNYHLSWGGSSFNFADHRSAGLATLDAAQDAGNPWIFPELMDEGAGTVERRPHDLHRRLPPTHPRRRRHRLLRQGRRLPGRTPRLPPKPPLRR